MRPIDTEVTVEQIIERSRDIVTLSAKQAQHYRDKLAKDPPSHPATLSALHRNLALAERDVRRHARLVDALVEACRGHCWDHQLTLLRGEAELAQQEADNAKMCFEWADYQKEDEARAVGYALGVARTLRTLVDSLEPAHGE